jgi:c-di-GMP-binding flagellar brake protein YcgR
MPIRPVSSLDNLARPGSWSVASWKTKTAAGNRLYGKLQAGRMDAWRKRMRLDDGLENMAGKQLDGGVENRVSNVNVRKVTRIPLKIDDEIMVRSSAIVAHRTKSRIIGAVHGDFILIQEPVVVISERLLAIFDHIFECSYFTEGYRYNFLSRYRRHVLRDIVCIEYPKEVDLHQIRKHRRIKVNIETKFAVLGAPNWFSAEMADISEGGCRLILESKETLTKGMRVLLVFRLPNEDVVDELRAVVMRSMSIEGSEATEVGLSFSGPQSELAKISNFCGFCMFFDVE